MLAHVFIMIRFVEMKGIYLDDTKKSFGFYNTVSGTFVELSGSYVFDTIKKFEMCYDKNCGVDYTRMRDKIPNDWLYDEEPL